MWRRWTPEWFLTHPKVPCHPPIVLSHPRWWLTFAQTPSWLSPIVQVSPTHSNCQQTLGHSPQPQLMPIQLQPSQQQGQVSSSLMSLLGSDNPILILIFTDISIRLVNHQKQQPATAAIQQQQLPPQHYNPSLLSHCLCPAQLPALLPSLLVITP